MSEVKQYIIIREDLGMSSGKLAAQASHAASNIFFDKMTLDEEEGSLTFFPTLEETTWLTEGRTKIVKRVKNEFQLMKAYDKAIELGLSVTKVTDLGKTELCGENVTAIAIGPNYTIDCEPVVKRLRNL